MISRRALIAASTAAIVPCMVVMQHGATVLIEEHEAIEAAGRKTNAHVDLEGFSDDAVNFSTSLPILVLDTGGVEIVEDHRVRGKFQLIGGDSLALGDTSHRYSLTDELAVNCYADLNIRGHSSADLSKKSYRVTLFKHQDDIDEDSKSLLGMAADSDWVLYGPYQDLTLMRNVFTYGIARECMEWAPDTRYVELWLNGSYRGLYVLVEKIQVDDNRIQLTDYTMLSGDTSFLIAREVPGSNEDEFESYTNFVGFLSQQNGILWPKVDRITIPQRRFIVDYINQFERSLYSDWYLDKRMGYRKYIDLDSWATYYTLEEFSANEDTGYHSTYCYRSTGGQLKAGPVWDFNSAYNNYVTIENDSEGFYLIDNTYFDRMCSDPVFVGAVIDKYRELRKGPLSDEALAKRAEACLAEIKEAIPRNDDVWDHYIVTGLSGDARKYATYDEAFNQFITYLHDRGTWLDEHIDDLYLNCRYMRGEEE